MKRSWLLAWALLTSAPGLLCAQNLTAPNANANAPAPGAFALDIRAPDDIRDLLERHLELLRYRELTDLSDSELARLLAAAEQDTRELVATLGYFSPDIRFEQPAAGSGPTTRRVTLTVAPGEPTLISGIELSFSGPISTDPQAGAQRQQMEDGWSLRPGMRFTQARWNNAKQQALLGLTRQRYPAAQLAASLADIDPVSHRARLSVTLDSGPAYRLGALVISGTQRYDTDLITRLARLTPGADYEQSQLVQAQQRLSDSGFFESIFVSLDSTGDPSAAPVLIQLREAQLQKLVLH